MATLSLFYGILITMRHEDWERHNKKPHLHARHAGKQASFDIATGEKLAGELDGDDEVKVQAWISIHREDLFANWTLLLEQGTFFKIEPLH